MTKEATTDSINKFFKKKYPEGFDYGELNKYSYSKGSKSYMPDNEIISGNRVDLVCVEKKLLKKDLQENIQKWILLSIQAKKQNGEFFLFTETSQKGDFESLIDRLQLNVKLISL